MISVNVHGHIDIHNVTILEGSAGVKLTLVSGFIREKESLTRLGPRDK